MSEVVKQPVSLKDIAKQEYTRCASDPAYFMKKYCYIQTDGGRSLFMLYIFQEKLIHIFRKYDRAIILKSRQLGITTLCACFALWLMLFHTDQKILAVAPDREKAKHIIDKIAFAYTNLPSWLIDMCNAKAVENAKHTLTLKNGSQAVAVSGSSKSARGKTASFLILDEAAFIDNAEDLWASAQQTLANITNGKAIVLSTPNGFDDFFHPLWQDAEIEKNTFVPVRLPWQSHPGHDEKWRKEQEVELGKRKAAQECFDGETRIFTNKGMCKISDIRVGDMVLTHEGRFRRVLRTMSHESDDVYGIKSSVNKIKRYVTKNHPFLYNNTWTELKNIDNEEYLPSFFNKSFIEKKNVKVDISEFIKPKYFRLVVEENEIYINDRKHKSKFPRFIDLDYDFGYILGLYLAEGSKSLNRVTFSFDYNKELNDWPQDLLRIFKNKFYLQGVFRKKKENGGDVDFSSQILTMLLDYFTVGNDCYTKGLSSIFYENINTDLLNGVLDGVFKGDGCIMDQYRKRLNTSSENLFYDIWYLMKMSGINGISNGVKSSKEAHFQNREDTYISSESYSLIVNASRGLTCDDRNITTIFPKMKYGIRKYNETKDDIYTHNRIFKEECVSKKIVYNLEVEEDHTYVTEHFIVHNCDCEFLTSGDNYFEPEDIAYYKEEVDKQENHPIDVSGPKKEIWTWAYPVVARNYMVIVDTARGDGSDSSAIEVIDIFTAEQVAEYNGDAEPKILAGIAVSMALQYNNALVVIENTGLGHETVSFVIETGYRNIYFTPKGDTMNVSDYLQKVFVEDLSKMTPGFSTTTKTRPFILSALRSYIHDRNLIIRSKRLHQQLTTFVWKNGKAAAQSGHNDDLVICYAMAVYLRDSAMQYQQNGLEITKAAIAGIQKAEPLALPVGHQNAAIAQTAWSMKVKNQDFDISWLVSQ